MEGTAKSSLTLLLLFKKQFNFHQNSNILFFKYYLGEFILCSTRGDPKLVFCGDRLRGVTAGEHIGVLKGVCLGVVIKFLFFEPKNIIKSIFF